MKCPTELLQAAVNDQLDETSRDRLQKHLCRCERCRDQLDDFTAGKRWWKDASRFLDESVLSDPQSDVDDSSHCGARLFEGDDPVGELRAIGALDPATHPEMLGKLGRYTIEREIGSGGMGVVLKAHDAELSRIVAIKVLAPHLARSGAARQRFIREGRAAAAVVHDNVVAIHEVDTSGKLPTLVMRYVDGISLQRHVDLYGTLSVYDALRIASQSASGLAAAHRQGIIHRDVKPGNIMVNHSCNRAWISDFGLARAVDDASLTRTGFIAGTPHYMSPEQARGGDVGPASDLFSLGAVIYFMFAARPPWRAERSLAVLHRIVQHDHRPLWKLNADVPRKVSDLVDRLLQKRVADRPTSASDVQAELEKALSELQNPESATGAVATVSSATVSVASSKPKWWSRPWFVAPVAAGLTAAAFLGIDPSSKSNVALSEPTLPELNPAIHEPNTDSPSEVYLGNAFSPIEPADNAFPNSTAMDNEVENRGTFDEYRRTFDESRQNFAAEPSRQMDVGRSEPITLQPPSQPANTRLRDDLRWNQRSGFSLPTALPAADIQLETENSTTQQSVTFSSSTKPVPTRESLWTELFTVEQMLLEIESETQFAPNVY